METMTFKKNKEMETIAPTPKETGKRESETEQEHQHHIDILPPSSRFIGFWGARGRGPLMISGTSTNPRRGNSTG
jgi:hypothetical protein